ncbi:MAG TPA: preprotein translocase subunit SecG [Myxococcota bacterium]|nr:preprotein translocase subunit SecG [Myxococcota bacterium]
MTLLVTFIYYAVCLILIVLVLLQHGKGADIGVSLGAGASQTVFGARGAGNFLTKLTTGSAILFMILAFGLARCSTEGSDLLTAPARTKAAEPAKKATEAAPEPTAPPSEPGAPPSGFEAVEPPKPSQSPSAPAPRPSSAPAPSAPAKPPS